MQPAVHLGQVLLLLPVVALCVALVAPSLSRGHGLCQAVAAAWQEPQTQTRLLPLGLSFAVVAFSKKILLQTLVLTLLALTPLAMGPMWKLVLLSLPLLLLWRQLLQAGLVSSACPLATASHGASLAPLQLQHHALLPLLQVQYHQKSRCQWLLLAVRACLLHWLLLPLASGRACGFKTAVATPLVPLWH